MPDKSRQNPGSEQAVRLILIFQQDPTPERQTRLVQQYKPLVEALASRFAKGQEPYEDLVQVGMIGLLGALRRFDPAIGGTFESFAVPTIVGEIKRHIRDKTWSVRVPRRIKELGPKIKRAADELTMQLQRSPQIADIARHLSITEEEVLETMEMGRHYHSLTVDGEMEADSDGNALTLLDLIGNREEGYTKVEYSMLLKRAMEVLTEREQDVIELTFYAELSQKRAGEQLGISQMHVSRLQRRALEKLRQALGEMGSGEE